MPSLEHIADHFYRARVLWEHGQCIISVKVLKRMSNEVVLRKRRIYQHMNFRNRHLSLPGGSMTIETSIVLLIYSPVIHLLSSNLVM